MEIFHSYEDANLEDFISAKTKLQKAMNSGQLPEHAVLLVKCNKALLGTGGCLLFNQQEI